MVNAQWRPGLLWVLLTAVTSSACLPRPNALPTGLGTPAPDTVALIAEMPELCRDQGIAESWVADVTIRGFAGTTSVDVRLRVAFEEPSARIESVPARGDRSFVLATSLNETTLVLGSGHYLTQPDGGATVLGALLGVRLTGEELGRLLRGCYEVGPMGPATSYGDRWRRIPGGRNGSMFFRRDALQELWRMVAVVNPGEGLEPAWRLDYLDFREGISRLLLFTNIGSPRMRLEVRLFNIDRRASLTPDLFLPRIPSSSRPIALANLSAARLFEGVAPR